MSNPPSSRNTLFMQCHPSGNRFYFPHIDGLEIDPTKISAEDIAYALSVQPRFGGHCHPVMSVAEHCWRVSYEVERENALLGLMHDDAEYLCIDLPTPIKALVPDYKTIERIVHEAIAEKFGFIEYRLDDVTRADRVLFCTEIRDLMGGTDGWNVRSPVLEPLPRRIIPMPRKLARIMFLRRLDELTAKPIRPMGFFNGLRWVIWRLKSWIKRKPESI